MRVALFGLAPRRSWFAWSFNYMLQDGWSFPIVLTDLLAFYDAHRAGVRPKERGARQPYRRFIEAQQRWDSTDAARFWMRTFTGWRGRTPLVEALGGVGRPLPGQPYATAVARVSADATGALRQVARGTRLTLNTFIQMIWAALLHERTGAQQVTFGNMIAGRPADLPGVEKMVGLFNNLLPIVLDVPEDGSALDWARQIRTQQVETHEHQHTPHALLRAASGTTEALFDSYLVYENFPIPSELMERGARQGVSFVGGNAQTEHALRIVILPRGAEMDLLFCYYEGHLGAREVGDLAHAMARAIEVLPRLAAGSVAELLAGVRG
jgi:hypothetical protein